jgi:hypothetical protein
MRSTEIERGFHLNKLVKWVLCSLAQNRAGFCDDSSGYVQQDISGIAEILTAAQECWIIQSVT